MSVSSTIMIILLTLLVVQSSVKDGQSRDKTCLQQPMPRLKIQCAMRSEGGSQEPYLSTSSGLYEINNFNCCT